MTCIFTMQNLVSYFLFSYCVIFYYFASILFAISLTCSMLLFFFSLCLSLCLSPFLPPLLLYSLIHSSARCLCGSLINLLPGPVMASPATSPVFFMFPHLSDISLFWFSYNVNEIFQALFNGDSNRYSFWLLIHCDVWLRYPIGDH